MVNAPEDGGQFPEACSCSVTGLGIDLATKILSPVHNSRLETLRDSITHAWPKRVLDARVPISAMFCARSKYGSSSRVGGFSRLAIIWPIELFGEPK
jgi:hypothetical protein